MLCQWSNPSSAQLPALLLLDAGVLELGKLLKRRCACNAAPATLTEPLRREAFPHYKQQRKRSRRGHTSQNCKLTQSTTDHAMPAHLGAAARRGGAPGATHSHPAQVPPPQSWPPHNALCAWAARLGAQRKH